MEDYRLAALVVLSTAMTFGAVKVLQQVVILYGKRPPCDAGKARR